MYLLKIKEDRPGIQKHTHAQFRIQERDLSSLLGKQLIQMTELVYSVL